MKYRHGPCTGFGAGQNTEALAKNGQPKNSPSIHCHNSHGSDQGILRGPNIAGFTALQPATQVCMHSCTIRLEQVRVFASYALKLTAFKGHMLLILNSIRTTEGVM